MFLFFISRAIKHDAFKVLINCGMCSLQLISMGFLEQRDQLKVVK